MIPHTISFIVDTIDSFQKCDEECTSKAFGDLTSILLEVARSVVEAIDPLEFPIREFIWFLLIFAFFYLGWGFVQRRLPSSHQLTAAATGANSLINVAFLALVVFSFYLCLAALLSIPLLQASAVAQGFSKEDLGAAMNNDLQTKADFDIRFPSLATGLDSAPGQASVPLVGDRKQISDSVIAEISALTDRVNGTRDAVYRELGSLKLRGVEAFRTQSAEKLSGGETIEHYDLVLNWWLSEKRSNEDSLSGCLATARSAVNRAKSVLDTIRTPAQAVEPEGSPRSLLEAYFGFRDQARAASDRCAEQIMTRGDPPPRPTRSQALKVIGPWIEWLLDTESLPLVIIVGLVGFSLLGATMSRVVRVGDNQGLDGLGLADLLKVTAGGAAAAMVVFLASYGGLTVLGEAKTDPNPYVVFIACLIAAIFSEDVWLWSRQKILGSITNGSAPLRGNRSEAGAAAAADSSATSTGGPSGPTGEMG